MRYALVVDKNEKTISEHFGEAAGFLVVDGDARNFVENPGCRVKGGRGVLAAEKLAELNLDALILADCSVNAGNKIKNAGIKILKAESKQVDENIEMFKNDKLSEFVDFHENKHKNADGRLAGEGRCLRNGEGSGEGVGAGEGVGTGIGNGGAPRHRNAPGLGRGAGRGICDGKRKCLGAGQGHGRGDRRGFGQGLGRVAGQGAGRGLGKGFNK